MLAVTAILAVGILAGCGSSNSTAGSAASAPASGVESSAASSEAAGEMGDVLPIDAGNLNEIKTGSYKFAASITKVADGQATLSVYGYDSYLPEDIDALQEGSVLRIHDQGDTTVTKLTVTSIDRDADNGYVTINGGIEAGGVELTLDHDVYRTVTFDDYPVYYEMGEVTLPLAGGVTLSDSSADRRLPPWRRTVPMPWPRPSTPSRTAGCPTTPWSLPRMAPSAASSASGCRKFCSKPLTNVLPYAII